MSRSARVSRLGAFFPNQEINFVYEGEILNSEQTLGDYAISDGSLIVAIPGPDQRSDAAQTWVRLTRTDNQVAQLAALCAQRNVREEYGRLRDLAIKKMEWKPRKYRRFARRDQSQTEFASSRQTTESTVIPESPDEMSTEPLPAPW
jgi:hypothetical protein